MLLTDNLSHLYGPWMSQNTKASQRQNVYKPSIHGRVFLWWGYKTSMTRFYTRRVPLRLSVREACEEPINKQKV